MIRKGHLILCCRFFVLILGFPVAFDAMGEQYDCPAVKPQIAQFGPFDYRDPKAPLSTVEIAHFTPDVATLKAGQSGYLEQDIDYTLRAFPNHHRALQSLADLALRTGKVKISGMHFSVPCFFIRASKFVPTDGMVDAIYAYYLARSNQKDLALTMARQAMQKTPKNPRIAYTVGLAYFYADDYKSARDYAKMAKDLGSTAVGLDNLLARKPEAAAPHK